MLPTVQQSIDISCPPGQQQQTYNSWFADVGPCWDRQADGQRTVTLLLILCGQCQQVYNSVAYVSLIPFLYD